MDFCLGGLLLNRALVFCLILGLGACGGSSSPPTDSSSPAPLITEDLVVGTGPVVEVGDTVTVDYVGRLTNGAQFDSSYDRGVPFTFTAGAGQVIAGWDQGVPGMRVGGRRRLTIPPHLAYGNNPPPGLPPNATLVFEIELHSIEGK